MPFRIKFSIALTSLSFSAASNVFTFRLTLLTPLQPAVVIVGLLVVGLLVVGPETVEQHIRL